VGDLQKRNKDLADRARDLWERLSGWVDELVGAPEPELVPIPVPVRRPPQR